MSKTTLNSPTRFKRLKNMITDPKLFLTLGLILVIPFSLTLVRKSQDTRNRAKNDKPAIAVTPTNTPIPTITGN